MGANINSGAIFILLPLNAIFLAMGLFNLEYVIIFLLQFLLVSYHVIFFSRRWIYFRIFIMLRAFYAPCFGDPFSVILEPKQPQVRCPSAMSSLARIGICIRRIYANKSF